MSDHPLVTYTFSIAIDGTLDPATDQPEREKWVRKYKFDAEAEAFARRLSEDRRCASVRIHRPDATWNLRAPTEG